MSTLAKAVGTSIRTVTKTPCGFLASGRQWIDHGPAATLVEEGYYRLVLPVLRGRGDSAQPLIRPPIRPMIWPTST
jgi:pimeloyl-ACP methyl ester carboxylesterase